MSMREPDFAGEIAITYLKYKAYAARAAELTAISTALGTDTTVHDKTIENPPVALQIGPTKTKFTNAINLIVNKGKGGNLSAASMVAAIDIVLGIPSKPGVVTIPYASANASPPIVGTVCSVTTGTWAGTPTSYTYQWTRNGVNIGAATAATYTLVSADTGGKDIRCVVSAVNAQGTTVAPPSNLIRVP